MPICESLAGTLNTMDGTKWGSNQWVREGKWVAMSTPDDKRHLPSHWDDPSAPHPTLNQSSKGTGAVGYSNQEIFSQRGAYLVPDTSDARPIRFDTTQITHPANYSNPRPGAPCHPLAAQGHPPAIAYNIYPGRPDANEAAKLSAMETQIANAVTVTEHARTTDRGTRIVEASPASIVRRLTPVECCRLQGFPDDWNAQGIDKAGKVIQMADSSRYKQLGNAVTVNVANWLAVRIAAVLRQDERPASTGQIAE